MKPIDMLIRDFILYSALTLPFWELLLFIYLQEMKYSGPFATIVGINIAFAIFYGIAIIIAMQFERIRTKDYY